MEDEREISDPEIYIYFRTPRLKYELKEIEILQPSQHTLLPRKPSHAAHLTNISFKESLECFPNLEEELWV